MGKKPSKTVLFYRQINYFIIERLWKYIHKERDIQDLYDLLGLNMNLYSKIRTGNDYQPVNLEKRWNMGNSKLKQTGLSEESMTGKKIIDIEGISEDDWKEYINQRYADNKNSAQRNSDMAYFLKKLNDAFDNLSLGNEFETEIEKLYYFLTYEKAVNKSIKDKSMIDLQNSLRKVSFDDMEKCEAGLRKDTYNIMKEKFRQLDIIIQYTEMKN